MANLFFNLYDLYLSTETIFKRTLLIKKKKKKKLLSVHKGGHAIVVAVRQSEEGELHQRRHSDRKGSDEPDRMIH